MGGPGAVARKIRCSLDVVVRNQDAQAHDPPWPVPIKEIATKRMVRSVLIIERLFDRFNRERNKLSLPKSMVFSLLLLGGLLSCLPFLFREAKCAIADWAQTQSTQPIRKPGIARPNPAIYYNF